MCLQMILKLGVVLDIFSARPSQSWTSAKLAFRGPFKQKKQTKKLLKTNLYLA